MKLNLEQGWRRSCYSTKYFKIVIHTIDKENKTTKVFTELRGWQIIRLIERFLLLDFRSSKNESSRWTVRKVLSRNQLLASVITRKMGIFWTLALHGRMVCRSIENYRKQLLAMLKAVKSISRPCYTEVREISNRWVRDFTNACTRSIHRCLPPFTLLDDLIYCRNPIWLSRIIHFITSRTMINRFLIIFFARNISICATTQTCTTVDTCLCHPLLN